MRMMPMSAEFIVSTLRHAILFPRWPYAWVRRARRNFLQSAGRGNLDDGGGIKLDVKLWKRRACLFQGFSLKTKDGPKARNDGSSSHIVPATDGVAVLSYVDLPPEWSWRPLQTSLPLDNNIQRAIQVCSRWSNNLEVSWTIPWLSVIVLRAREFLICSVFVGEVRIQD